MKEYQNLQLSAELVNHIECISNEYRKQREAAERIRLNVILITYNHEEYIEESLKSILAQCTDFRFNIIVADDCSTDRTVESIQKFEAETDIPFVYLKNTKNLGIKENYRRAFAACSAEYVAIMEGDDIWQDPYRLQKHFRFLEEHLECSMSFNQYIVKNFEKNQAHVQPVFFTEKNATYKLVTGQELAFDNLIGNFSTCVYRTAYLRMLPEAYYQVFAYDWLLNILLSRMGYVGCLLQPMSIYRIHEGSVWSSQKATEKNRMLYNAIDIYDKMTDREFTDQFTAYKNRLAEMIRREESPNLESFPTDTENVSGKKRRLKKAIIAFRKLCYGISDSILPPIVTKLFLGVIPPRIQRKIMNMREN